MADPLELAWAAGFWDGEGSACIGQRDHVRGYAYLNMMLKQVDRRPLDRFQEAVGVGKVRGPYANGMWSPYYMWRTSQTESWKVVNLLWNYLSEPKREQIWTVAQEAS